MSIGARVNTVEDAQKIVDLFVSYGHNKIDTSRVYGGGTSEEVCSLRIPKVTGRSVGREELTPLFYPVYQSA